MSLMCGLLYVVRRPSIKLTPVPLIFHTIRAGRDTPQPFGRHVADKDLPIHPSGPSLGRGTAPASV